MSADERVTVRLQVRDAARFMAEMKAAGHEVEVLGDKADRAGKKAKPFASELDRINKVTKAMRWPVAIASVGIIGQVLASAATGGVAFGAALVPLVGVMATLPAFAAGAAQAMGVLGLAFSGVGGAVGGLNAQIDPTKFALLSRPAQDFALTLDSLKGRVRGLQSSVQAGLFPGLTLGLREAAPALDALRSPLAGTGRVFGLMGARLGALVGSRGFLTDLAAQARFNNVQFTRLGGAGLHVVNLLRNLTVTARPLVSWMVRLAAGWAASADSAVALGRRTGGLERMFHGVQVTMSRVGRIGSDLAVMFFNIGRIGKSSLGDSLLVSLVRGSDALRQWTESGPGVQKITKFFVDAKPVIYATGKLLGDVATQLLRFGAGSDGGLVHILLTFDSMVSTIGWLARLVGPSTVVYGFLALKGIGAAYKLMQIAKGIEAITAASTLLGGAKAAENVTAASAAGAASGRAYGLAFRAGAAIAIGLFLENEAKKHPAIAQYSGKKGWGELYRDSKHDVSRVAGALGKVGGGVVHALTPRLPGRAMGGPVWPGQYLVGERGPEVLSIPAHGWVTPNHELGRGPRSSPVARATAASGGGDALAGRLQVTVVPQPIYLDGVQLTEVTAEVAVKHESRH